jgi:UDP-glucose 4-epimerase
MLHHNNPAPTPPQRVVVVGAGGFVGGAVAARLEQDGVPVLCLGRHDIDLLAADARERLAGILLAGDVLVAASAMAPCRSADMLRENMVIAAALVAAAAAAAPLAQVVNISSDAVYADSSEPLTEASPKAPDSLHGVMHLAREIMFKSAVAAPLVMLRPTLIYGAADPHNGYGPNRFLCLAAAGEPIVLFGKGEERRDHVLIDDVAELVARVVYHRSSGALNIATGQVTSFRDIADMVVRIAGTEVPVIETPRTQPMPHNGYRAFATDACRAAFADFAFTPIEEGLRLTAAARERAAPAH